MAIKTTRGKMSSVIHMTKGAQMLEMCTETGSVFTYLTSYVDAQPSQRYLHCYSYAAKFFFYPYMVITAEP